MFVLAELQYIIRVEPRRFGKDMEKEITDELNRKFANKVRTNYDIRIIPTPDWPRICAMHIFKR